MIDLTPITPKNQNQAKYISKIVINKYGAIIDPKNESAEIPLGEATPENLKKLESSLEYKNREVQDS